MELLFVPPVVENLGLILVLGKANPDLGLLLELGLLEVVLCGDLVTKGLPRVDGDRPVGRMCTE